METALSYYGFIPEGVYTITAITTLLPRSWETRLGTFRYSMVKPSYFFGYTYLKYENRQILIATPEKTILDYFYLHPELKTESDFAGLRMNPMSWKEKIHIETVHRYLAMMNNKALTTRVTKFITYMNSYGTD